mmetsp:Transcript_14337/g.21642  ORF Transcript_14337/g.21642 Transcript_14337/m.21642 type:complete len:626 (+) Transcript_14337:150-2027(+)
MGIGSAVHLLSVVSFASSLAIGGGGRAATSQERIVRQQETEKLSPIIEPNEVRICIVQITDVYTLENFPSLRTLILEAKRRNPNTISILTGDFLAPYLLSTVDKGNGMMKMLASTPIDYVSIGNHEDEIPQRAFCSHVRNFPGTFINSNMRDHEAMEYMNDKVVIRAVSPDGKHKRKLGLCAVLSNDPGLYSKSSFGGATIDDPWETLAKYKKILQEDEGCDIVIPLQHLYVPDDHRTCREFDFPIILSGHDHHRVDEVVEGTRLLKPGLDSIYATILELSWSSNSDDNIQKPPDKISAHFAKVSDFPPDETLLHQVEEAYKVLAPLRNTELTQIPDSFRPLSSFNARGQVTTMGVFLCSTMRAALRAQGIDVDAVLLMGGNVRAGKKYDDDEKFMSLEILESEIKSDETLGLIWMPGSLISKGVQATHIGDPIPGWMQFCNETIQDPETKAITHVRGEPIDPDRLYLVATKIPDLTNGQSPPWTEYFKANPNLLPPKGAYFNIHATLMELFARDLWLRLWDQIAKGRKPNEILDILDADGDGAITVDDIHLAIQGILGLSADPTEKSLARFIHDFADCTGDGRVTIQDLQSFEADVCHVDPLIHQTTTIVPPKVAAEESFSTTK